MKPLPQLADEIANRNGIVGFPDAVLSFFARRLIDKDGNVAFDPDNAVVTFAALAKGAPSIATRSLHIPLGTIATTGAATAVTIAIPAAAILVGAAILSKAGLATDDTNYLTFSLVNKGQLGTGAVAMLSAAATTQTTGGKAIVAYKTRLLTLNATPANLVLAANDALEFVATAAGTLANTVTEASLRLDYLVAS